MIDRLFFYHIGYISRFVGTDKQQIIRTLAYYKELGRGGDKDLIIPNESDIEERENIKIYSVFPLSVVGHDITVKPRNNIEFVINATAYDYVEGYSKNYQTKKKGELYLFSPGCENDGRWWLPESVMEGLRQYDWSQHYQEVALMMEDRDERLAGISGIQIVGNKFPHKES